jgi:hypothetical protein
MSAALVFLLAVGAGLSKLLRPAVVPAKAWCSFISGIADFAAGAVLRSFVAGAKATVFQLDLECFHLKSPLALSCL